MPKIKHLSKFRPINLIFGKGNRLIRNNLLFRSDALNKIHEKEANILKDKYHISTIIDFRNENERDNKPDYLPKDVNYVSIPLLENEDSPIVTKENRLGILLDLMKQEGGTEKEITDYYKKIVTNPKSINGYKKAFEILLDNKDRKGILYHCTQGKDRTGLFTVYILYCLGANQYTIGRAYMDYNKMNRFTAYLIAFAMTSRYFSIKKAIALNNILVAKRSYLKAAYDTINKEFGSFDSYMSNQLGMDEEKRKELRRIYLR